MLSAATPAASMRTSFCVFIAFSLESVAGLESAGLGVKRASRENPSRNFSRFGDTPGTLARARGNGYRQGWTSHDRSAE
ncbi:hypothetical protein PCAR4_290175 [Paraburkholderia caribensis]|nr:hypothetical protein PCAR4_290175 [Paraburkholderia caribensis]